MEYRSILKNRTILVLLFIIVLNVVAFVLVMSIDGFVNVNLYDYGLQFSTNWPMITGIILVFSGRF